MNKTFQVNLLENLQKSLLTTYRLVGKLKLWKLVQKIKLF